eukprot:4139583-Alexandrium_andersonii.AAC.1
MSADQSRAFGRVVWLWMDHVLRRWECPSWLRRPLLAAVVGRSVAPILETGAGPPWELERSRGM